MNSSLFSRLNSIRLTIAFRYLFLVSASRLSSSSAFNASVKITGEVNLDKIEEATIIFLKKLKRRKKNGDDDKTRIIIKQ